MIHYQITIQVEEVHASMDNKISIHKIEPQATVLLSDDKETIVECFNTMKNVCESLVQSFNN